MPGDPNIQGLVDTWNNQQIPELTFWNPSFSQNGAVASDGPGSNAVGPRSDTQVPGVADFLKNNPIISNSEFNDLTGTSGTPSAGVALPGSSLTDLLQQKTPDSLTKLFQDYQTRGETALKNMSAPVDMTDYKTSAAMSGQFDKSGNVNIPQVAQDFQTTQQQQYQASQQTNTQVEAALATLTDPSTAAGATQAFVSNAIGFVLSNVDPDIAEYGGAEVLQQIASQAQENMNNFDNYSTRMQQIFTSYLNISYNLSGDMTTALWASNVAPQQMQAQQDAVPAAQAAQDRAVYNWNQFGPGNQ